MRRLFITVLFIGWQLLSSSILAKEDTETTTILVWGDSLSSAYGLAVDQGWVFLLQQRLGKDHKVINASVSGETSGGGRSRLSEALHRHRPDIVIIELGGNDGLRGLPPSVTRKNLEEMIVIARKLEVKVLLLGIKLPPNYGPQYSHRFETIYPEVAQKYNVPLVPFLLNGIAEDFSLMQKDGIHPTAEAQPKVLDNVMQTLKKLIE